MSTPLKSRFEEIIESLKKEGSVEVVSTDEKVLNTLKEEVEKELDDYRFENQKRIKESQEDIATVVLTS